MQHESITFFEDFCFGKTSIRSFEQALYISQEIEEIVGNESYLEMLELDYNNTNEIISKLPWLMKVLVKCDPEYYQIKFLAMRDRIHLSLYLAFEGVNRKDGRSFHQAIVLDNRGSDQEFKDAIRFDTDQKWEDVKNELIAVTSSNMTFLDARGMRYYLPAYIRYLLTAFTFERYDSYYEDIACHIAWNLAKDGHYSAKLISLLSAPQKQIVARFMYWIILSCRLAKFKNMAEEDLIITFQETWQYYGDFVFESE